MRFATPGLFIAFLVAASEASNGNRYCQDTTCLQAVRHPPGYGSGCSSFFRKRVTPVPVTRTARTTVVVHRTKTVTDGYPVYTVIHPKISKTEVETSTISSVTTTVVPTTETTTSPITVPSTTTDTESETVYTQTTTTTFTLPVVAPPMIVAPPPVLRRNYPVANPSCPQPSYSQSKVPAYASACSNAAAYSSACSCIGARHVTTTLPACTTTVTPTRVSTHTVHVAKTVTITGYPEIKKTTTTTSTTTVSTTTSTSTSITTEPTTITDGITTVSTTTTISTVSTSTLTYNPACTEPASFSLEITGANYPIPVELGTTDGSRGRLVQLGLTGAPLATEFQLDDDVLQVKADSRLAFRPVEGFRYVYLDPLSTVSGFLLHCFFGFPDAVTCKRPFLCSDYIDNMDFYYCTANGTNPEGLAFGFDEPPSSDICSPVQLAAEDFPII